MKGQSKMPQSYFERGTMILNTSKQHSKEEIGRRIRELRIKKGMSQEQLAKAVGYTSDNSRSTINKVEQGQNDIVQSKLKAYAKALDVTVGYLLGIEDADGFDIAYEPEERKSEVNAFEVVQNAYGKDAVELLKIFVQLNELGQQKALEQISDLFEIKKYIK